MVFLLFRSFEAIYKQTFDTSLSPTLDVHWYRSHQIGHLKSTENEKIIFEFHWKKTRAHLVVSEIMEINSI